MATQIASKHKWNLSNLLCMNRYDSLPASVQDLKKEHQQMADILKEAEQQGILDVYLATVTQQEYLSISDYGPRSVEVNDTVVTVNDWRDWAAASPNGTQRI